MEAVHALNPAPFTPALQKVAEPPMRFRITCHTL
jgi:hypothetical protein